MLAHIAGAPIEEMLAFAPLGLAALAQLLRWRV